MTHSIWKFDLPVDDTIVIEMPKGAKVLDVQTQHGQPCIWAIVDTECETEPRTFFMRDTGHPLNFAIESARYIGTIQMDDGALIFHLFEPI